MIWLWLVTNLVQYVFLSSFLLILTNIYLIVFKLTLTRSVTDLNRGMFWLYLSVDTAHFHMCYWNHQCQWPRTWLLLDHWCWCTGPVVENNVKVMTSFSFINIYLKNCEWKVVEFRKYRRRFDPAVHRAIYPWWLKLKGDVLNNFVYRK
jgi:hypothetical protein